MRTLNHFIQYLMHLGVVLRDQRRSWVLIVFILIWPFVLTGVGLSPSGHDLTVFSVLVGVSIVWLVLTAMAAGYLLGVRPGVEGRIWRKTRSLDWGVHAYQTARVSSWVGTGVAYRYLGQPKQFLHVLVSTIGVVLLLAVFWFSIAELDWWIVPLCAISCFLGVPRLLQALYGYVRAPGLKLEPSYDDLMDAQGITVANRFRVEGGTEILLSREDYARAVDQILADRARNMRFCRQEGEFRPFLRRVSPRRKEPQTSKPARRRKPKARAAPAES